jgi:hypothetical protein
VSVLANDEESSTFKTGKGLRRGDPFSPFLFNLVGDVLIKILDKATRGGYISCLLNDFRPGGLLLCNMLIILCFSPIVVMSPYGILRGCSCFLRGWQV